MTVHKRVELANGSIAVFMSNVGSIPRMWIDNAPVNYNEFKHLIFPNTGIDDERESKEGN